MNYILKGQRPSTWQTGKGVVAALKGKPDDWEPRWAKAERRHEEGRRAGKFPPLPWVEDDSERPTKESLGVGDWQRPRRATWRWARSMAWTLLGLLGITTAAGLVAWRQDKVGFAAAGLALAVELAAAAAWQQQHRHRANSSLRRRQVMIKHVLFRAEETLSHRGKNLYLHPRFTRLTDEPGTRRDRRRHRRSSGPHAIREPVAEDTTLRELFGSAAESLVLIGDSGLGKTTQLATLARELSLEALKQIEEIDTGQRHKPPVIPLLLSLARYRGQPLHDWIADEVRIAYDGISTEITRAWLAEDAILPLLDGLDRVPEEHRYACAEEIRQFREQCTGVVVTCRERDYGLAKTIRALQYIELGKPDRHQVQAYLTTHADALADVRAALEADRNLWGLLQSPLMLNIISHTYAHRPATELRDPGTPEQRLSRILDAYVRRMLDHRSTSYQDRETLQWLTWLARTLTARGEHVLYLDRIDPTWVPRAVGDPWDTVGGIRGRRYSALWNLLTLDGLVERLEGGQGGGRRNSPPGRWSVDAITIGLIAGIAVLLGAVFLAATGTLTEPDLLGIAAFLFIASGRLWGSVLEHLLIKGVNPVERVTWTWQWRSSTTDNYKNIVSTDFKHLTMFHVITNAMQVFFIFVSMGTVSAHPDDLSAIAFFFAAALGCAELFISDRLIPHITEHRAQPNEGIRRSARYCAISAICFGLTAGVLTAGITMLSDDTTTPGRMALTGLIVGTYIGLSRGLGLGGYAVLRHIVMRVLLARSGSAPLRYKHFLHDSEIRILLRRSGSGFIFPHQLLLEHFDIPYESLLARVHGDCPTAHMGENAGPRS
ncbi:NACHT domain-containing protein [Wenjunlia tyrosinilytica]|uniref:NACHT domain-containing protein n=1 Tax=Wenjunlia tyrosinilytica TaxID=1544741 RepID=UPI00166C95FB|nr:hypothetical protein [Wenjunlia tyrosinilytica]